MSQYTPGSAGAQIGENVIADKLDEMIEVLQPTNACTDIDISVPSSGWSSSSPYQYTYLNSKITDGCSIKTNFLEGNTDAVLYLESEKVTGGVRFTAPTKPTTSISVRIHVLNADATSTSSIDATEVSTNVISGSSNVAQALTSINNQITLTTQAVTLSENVGASSSVNCNIVGSIVIIDMSISVSSSIASNGKLFTNAPAPRTGTKAYGVISGIGKTLPIAINSSGECFVEGAAGSNTGWMDGCIVYVK